MLCAHVESHRCSKFVKLAKTVSGREVIEFEEKYLRVTKQKRTEISKEIIFKKNRFCRIYWSFNPLFYGDYASTREYHNQGNK